MNITHETRRESRNAIVPIAGKRKKIILDVLGDREMTATEIAEALFAMGYTPFFERNYAAPRLTEMKEEGKVEVVGKKVCERTGRTIAVWKRRIYSVALFESR